VACTQDFIRYEDEKLIGVYSTKENARGAITRLKEQPGFKEFPGGFQIYEHELDVDAWTEGFITVV
jgi:hypothetical protein